MSTLQWWVRTYMYIMTNFDLNLISIYYASFDCVCSIQYILICMYNELNVLRDTWCMNKFWMLRILWLCSLYTDRQASLLTDYTARRKPQILFHHLFHLILYSVLVRRSISLICLEHPVSIAQQDTLRPHYVMYGHPLAL